MDPTRSAISPKPGQRTFTNTISLHSWNFAQNTIRRYSSHDNPSSTGMVQISENEDSMCQTAKAALVGSRVWKTYPTSLASWTALSHSRRWKFRNSMRGPRMLKPGSTIGQAAQEAYTGLSRKPLTWLQISFSLRMGCGRFCNFERSLEHQYESGCCIHPLNRSQFLLYLHI